MKFLRIAALVILPVLTLALGFGVGVRYESGAATGQDSRLEDLFSVSSGSGQVIQGDPEKQVDLTLLWSVWRLLQKYYLEPQQLLTDKMVFGAVSGMVDAVGDPYTLFLSPKENKEFSDSLSGTLEGIGAQLDVRDGQIVVVSPIKGSPADAAGLASKDVIAAVDGVSAAGMKLEDIVKLIRGPKGTKVTLTIIRPPKTEPMTIVVTRDSIHIPSVESSIKQTASGTIGIVTLNQFGDDTVAETEKALKALPKDTKGLVLDLRYNGGGYLDGAISIVSMFVAKGNVVSVVHRDTAPEVHAVTGAPVVPTLPMVVLVNGGSASASEITAGALHDLARARLIGMQTFGKGTVQEVIELPGGSALRVTIAKWLTPSGHDLGKKGIAPDIVIDRTLEQYRAGVDPQMDAALATLMGKHVKSEVTGTGAVR